MKLVENTVKEKPIEKKVSKTNEISAKNFGLWDEKEGEPELKPKKIKLDRTMSPKKNLKIIEQNVGSEEKIINLQRSIMEDVKKEMLEKLEK